MEKSAYIGFENEANNYKLYYGEVVENNDLTIRKGNGALKRMLQALEEDPTVNYIMFIDTNGKPYNTLYVDDNMVLLDRERELISINLKTEKVYARELDWWVNDTEDFKEFLNNLLARNEIEFDDEIINSITIRFENQ